MANDFISLVEIAHRLDLDDGAWIDDICERAIAVHGDGPAVIAGHYRCQPTCLQRVAASDRGLPEEIRAAYPMPHEAMPPEFVAFFRRPGVRSGLSSKQADAESIERFCAVAGPYGIWDAFNLQAVDDNGEGFMLSLCLGETGRFPSKRRRLWSRAFLHIAAAVRLRASLARARDASLDAADAVLDEHGHLQHAPDKHAQARRDALRAAACRIDRARGAARHNDDDALELWRGLVAGRWTLIEQFDTDGRRFLVARRNEPGMAALTALSDRERQVVLGVICGHTNKLIAYQLGLSSSTVATHLASAQRKLGVASRSELSALAHRLGALSQGGGDGARGPLDERSTE